MKPILVRLASGRLLGEAGLGQGAQNRPRIIGSSKT